MSRPYFKVGPSFWVDHTWNDDERLLALYLLTCPHRTTEGIFRMPAQYAMTDLGWSPKRFAKAFDQLQSDGFVEYDSNASVCLIVNALKWQAPENPNQVKAALKHIRSLPATGLLTRFRTLAGTLSPRLAEALTEEFGEGVAHPPALAPTPPPSQRLSGGALSETGREPQPLPTGFLRRI